MPRTPAPTPVRRDAILVDDGEFDRARLPPRPGEFC
jgi:hypothetical protein